VFLSPVPNTPWHVAYDNERLREDRELKGELELRSHTVAAGAEAMNLATEGEAAAVAAGDEAMEVATEGEAVAVAAGASGDA